MKPVVKTIISIAAILALAAPLSAADKKVILITLDGLKGPTLASLLERKLKTPNLNEFVSKGTVSEGLLGIFPTVTYPSHTTIATGRSSAAHGIVGNSIFDPEHRMNSAWHWYAEEIRVPALWDAARQKGLKTAAVSWPVTVGAAIDANLPEFRVPRTIEDKMLFRAASTPGLLAEFEKADQPVPLTQRQEEEYMRVRMAAFAGSTPEQITELEKASRAVPVTGQDDYMRARMAAFLIRTRKPDLLMVHLYDLDHAQHGHGPDAPEAMKTLEENDECLGLIRQAVRDAGLEKQTVFVVVSDHGFWPVEKTFSPNAVITALGLAAPADKREEWRVGVYANGGSFALYARNPADREAIESATKTFLRLKDEGIWGVDKVASRKELDEAKAYPGAFLAVSLARGFTVGQSTGAWVIASGRLGGMHGYWPGPVEMDAAFVAFGEGVRPQRLPRGKLVDVAPTVAKILGLTMDGVEGASLLP